MSTHTLEETIKPSKTREFYSTYHLWFPSESCPFRRSEWIEAKLQSREWSPGECCNKQQQFDKRTRELFKTDRKNGTSLVCLCSKTYFGDELVTKQTCKGLNTHQNVFTLDSYLDESGFGTNASFRVKNHHIMTYKKIVLHCHTCIVNVLFYQTAFLLHL